jgi:hypothetical protein
MPVREARVPLPVITALSESGLAGCAIPVFLALLAHRNGVSSEAFPAQTTIAGQVARSERTVRDAIHRLESQGFIRVLRASRRRSLEYVFPDYASGEVLFPDSVRKEIDASPEACRMHQACESGVGRAQRVAEHEHVEHVAPVGNPDGPTDATPPPPEVRSGILEMLDRRPGCVSPKAKEANR